MVATTRVRARWELVAKESTPDRMVIRDIGNHSKQPTITNDAEAVVEYIFAFCDVTSRTRLFYHDSDGRLDELLVKDGKFAGFAPGPR